MSLTLYQIVDLYPSTYDDEYYAKGSSYTIKPEDCYDSPQTILELWRDAGYDVQPVTRDEYTVNCLGNTDLYLVGGLLKGIHQEGWDD